ncbi:MAG TPA: efflux RND transporter permease subunit [Methylomusa anaerophila]|uniref:Multidrug resistance protein MdtC n=1 Tax=Methylomusa anaerophila TaxID=1930071 RepID=A0A348AHC8_9FIRM|nr:efflux RND transporter permease subunit [Methylomusa anaerophila]BBB90476.1 multidrug resistance protein MdtC [Methylomusa anaerophila]HML89881.1 efflux RND transporter permease subunit [Methylomusa anaerophila]
MNIIATFIKRPVFTVMLVMLLVVFGVQAYPSLGIDLYPDVDFPIVAVSVSYAGTGPEEMESQVTKPVEDAVSAISGIKTLSSVTKEGISQVVIEFEFGTNARLAANEVREKVATIRKQLPDQIDEPVIQRFDIGAQPILFFSLSSDSRSPGEVRKLATDVVKNELQRIDGVADVSIAGASDREIQVQADSKKLEAYKITMPQILDAINSQNLNAPGGHVKGQGLDLTVRTVGVYKSIEDISNIIVANQDGRLIKLSDVAAVKDSWAEETAIARANGAPAVLVSVQKQSGANTVDVASKVKQAVNGLQDTLPDDIKVQITRDSSEYIKSSVEDVMTSLVFGGLLAVAITFLFLGNTRATLIGAIALPTSVVATFFLMKAMNFTLNNMSLMGLSLAVGILIDDAIVVIENIYRHMEQGKSAWEAARDGTGEIALAVMATTFSILAVFVPVGSMTGIIGQFFKQFGLTVAFAVAFSLFVAFTLTPTLAAYWLKPHDGTGEGASRNWLKRVLDKWEQGFTAVQAGYRRLLAWVLTYPKKLLAIAVLSLFLNFLLVPFLGSEFQPSYDSGEFSITLTAPAGTSLEKMQQLSLPIEAEIMAIPELQSSYSVVGDGNQANKASIGVKLVASGKRHRSMEQIMDGLRLKFRDVGDLKVAVENGQSIGRGESRPVQVALRGPDLEVLMHTAQNLAEKIKAIPGTMDVDISSEQSVPEVQVKLNALRLSDAGLDASTVAGTVQMAFQGGITRNKYNAGDNDYNIRVQLAADSRMSIDDVANLRVAGKTGAFIRLGDVADIQLSSGPTQIDRESRQRQVIVYAGVAGTSAGEVINKVTSLMPSMNLPLGYTYKFVGQAQIMQDSFNEIGKALALAIVLIYMVLAAQFESFIHPFTIMLSLPFSLIGAILGLLVAGQTMNIMSLIGVIMLMGLVTKNAILLVDYTNQLRAGGMGITEALIEAGSVRLRPILMTTAAMIFGMMPIALGIGAGAELRQSMGVVLIGGLMTSTLLTLVVVPSVYLLIDGVKNRFVAKKEVTLRGN